MIDDWLYDERVDPHSRPAIVCEAAIRLMTEEKYRISLPHKGNLKACSPMGDVSEPKDIADAVVDLTEASHVTGEVPHVDDGGHVCRW